MKLGALALLTRHLVTKSVRDGMILGGVPFSSSTRRHFAITGRLILAYLGVSAPHALWDSMHGIALVLTLLITEGESYRRTPNGWMVQPTAEQARLFPVLEWAGLAVVSVIGIGWLVALWRRAPRPYRVGWRIPIPPPHPYPGR